MNFKFFVTNFAFTEFQKILTFGLWLHKSSAAEVEAEDEKPSAFGRPLLE